MSSPGLEALAATLVCGAHACMHARVHARVRVHARARTPVDVALVERGVGDEGPPLLAARPRLDNRADAGLNGDWEVDPG